MFNKLDSAQCYKSAVRAVALDIAKSAVELNTDQSKFEDMVEQGVHELIAANYGLYEPTVMLREVRKIASDEFEDLTKNYLDICKSCQ